MRKEGEEMSLQQMKYLCTKLPATTFFNQLCRGISRHGHELTPTESRLAVFGLRQSPAVIKVAIERGGFIFSEVLRKLFEQGKEGDEIREEERKAEEERKRREEEEMKARQVGCCRMLVADVIGHLPDTCSNCHKYSSELGCTGEPDKEVFILDADQVYSRVATEMLHSLRLLISKNESKVWVCGDTYPVKDELKRAGGRWNRDKNAWEFDIGKAFELADLVYKLDKATDPRSQGLVQCWECGRWFKPTRGSWDGFGWYCGC